MRTVSIRLEDLAKMAIKIGFVGENEHTRVRIDCKKAFEEYPNAAAALTVQPPAGEAYPDVTTRDGDTVIWDVEDHDLTDEGDGEFQLSFVVDETVMKSYIGRTTICRSILPAGNVPAAIDDWLTRANAALAEIPVEIAAALEEAKESGEFDGRGISDAVLNSDYTLTLTFTDGTSYTTPSIRGEKGKDFTIAKTFSSTAQMEAYTGTDIEAGDFVMINTGDTEDADNGKLFCYMPGVNILNTSTMTADVSPNKNYIFSATLTVTSGTEQDVTIWHTVTQGLAKVEDELYYFNIGTTFNKRINITTEQYDSGLRFTFSHLSVSNVTLTEKWGYICDLSGPQGEQGIQGEEGEPGVSPTASVTKSGDTATITITDKNGTTTAQVTDGATGETGASPVFSIGTVTTGDAGTNAAVTQSGTDLAPVLNFTIPKGAKGDAGNGDMLAPAFAEGSANAAGTYVTYNGGLYLLPNGHTANTTWANTSKTSVTIGGQLSDQKSAFDRYSEWLSIDDNVEQGALTSTGAVTTSSYNAWVRSPDYVPIEKFIEFYKPSGIAADFFIYDGSKALLEKVTPSANTSITLSYAYTIGKQATAKYIKIRAQRNGESTTTPAQFVASGSHVKIAVPETELLEKIDDNAEDISSLEGQMTTEVPITLGITHYIIADNGTATGNPQYDCTDYIPVEKGMKVVISSAIGSGYHALLVYDATKNVIDTYLTNTDVANAEYNITSDSAKFIRAQSRNNTWGTITNSLSVKVYQNTFDYYKSEIEEIKASKPIAVERVNSAKFTISVKSRNGSVVRYDFEKYSKTWESLTYEDGNGNEQTASNVVSANYWNNLYVYNNLTSEYIAQGNSNFIVQVYGDSYHVGDGHGNEVLASFVLICDGKEVDVSSMSNNQIIECEKLLLIEKSYMYKLGGGTADSYANTYPALDTSGNPIVNFIHNMEMSFDVNGVDINNSLLVKQDGISFQQCHGAMLECYYANFDILSCNNAEESVNTIASDGTATVNTGSTVNLKTYPAQIADYVEMYGKNFYISQKMEQVNPVRYGKSNVRFVFYDNRVKAYFQPVFAEFGLPSGETRETFNTGDVIRVTDHRRIDLQGI